MVFVPEDEINNSIVFLLIFLCHGCGRFAVVLPLSCVVAIVVLLFFFLCLVWCFNVSYSGISNFLEW